MEHEAKSGMRPGDGSNGNDSDEVKHGEKTVQQDHERDLELQDRHLVELEVDLSRVLVKDEEIEGDWDADTSPFAAVRAVVPETDDPEMPVNTFRAWFLGIVSWPPFTRNATI
jgi:hypothetical protein